MAKCLKITDINNCEFMLSLLHDSDFDGMNDGYDGEYMPLIKPKSNKEQLELSIKAAQKIYWEFQEEYMKTYGEMYNG